MSQYNRPSSGGRNQFDITDDDMKEHRENWDNSSSSFVGSTFTLNAATKIKVIDETDVSLNIEIEGEAKLPAKILKQDLIDGLQAGLIIKE